MGGIAFEDLIDELVVLLGELERNVGIVHGCISMLGAKMLASAGRWLLRGGTYDVEGITGNFRACREGPTLRP